MASPKADSVQLDNSIDLEAINPAPPATRIPFPGHLSLVSLSTSLLVFIRFPEHSREGKSGNLTQKAGSQKWTFLLLT